MNKLLYLAAYDKAARRRLEFETVRVVNLNTSSRVEREEPDRIITSRVAYKDHNRKEPNLPVDLKARKKLYLRPPKCEGFPGRGSGQLLKLFCSVFGLTDARRTWWKNFVQRSLRLDFKQLVLDA